MSLTEEAQKSINEDKKQESINAVKYRLNKIGYHQELIEKIHKEIILIEEGKLSNIGENMECERD